jgi:hypothetical protein
MPSTRRKHPVSYPYERPIPKLKKLSARTDDLQETTYKDKILGRYTARFKALQDGTWENPGEPSAASRNDFAWVNWEGQDTGLVYILEQRGELALIVCFEEAPDRAETGFMNEYKFDKSNPGCPIVPLDTLSSPVTDK